MKTLVSSASLSMLLALAAPAFAADPAPADSTDGKPAVERKKDLHPFCVRETGTRIRHAGRRGSCMAPGRTYSRDELMSTGEVDMAQALRRLDPSIR